MTSYLKLRHNRFWDVTNGRIHKIKIKFEFLTILTLALQCQVQHMKNTICKTDIMVTSSNF